MLFETFVRLLTDYTDDDRLIAELWSEIQTSYTHKKRHYHNLTHLENLLGELDAVKAQIGDWNTVLFTLFYHDVVYNTLKTDNEEKSAALAEKRMRQADVPAAVIEQCIRQILATKKHQASPDPDTNYFTDADLSILGHSWEEYERYFNNIRKEYVIYPDLVYKPGRKKVLQHFLQMERIFKTDFFYAKYESQAKLNLRQELDRMMTA